jgi:hypothetical protein
VPSGNTRTPFEALEAVTVNFYISTRYQIDMKHIHDLTAQTVVLNCGMNSLPIHADCASVPGVVLDP